MKKKILFTLTFSLLLTLMVSAQTPSTDQLKAEARMERGRKAKAELDAISNLSPSLKSLKGNDKELITEAARTGDPAVIGHLKVLASDTEARTRMESAAFQAHIALGKLGDPEVLPEIVVELDTGKSSIRHAAIAKLAQIGSKAAYQKLYELLDDPNLIDNANRDNNQASDELPVPNSCRVMQELAKIFENTPKKPNGATSRDVSVWKDWFAKHKKLIE